jgi:hypothetical protein
MTTVVFWIQQTDIDAPPGMARFHLFRDDQLMDALAFMGEKRTEVGASHVCMVSEPEGMVGTKDAGGSVENGRLPDGTDYTWKKRRL